MAGIPFKEKQRNKRIRDRVVDMYSQFVSEVDPKNVFDLLIEKRVISIEQKQKFMIKDTTKERCRALLDHLLYCSNEESFIVLRDALEDQYHWIVERIDQCETDNENTRISDANMDISVDEKSKRKFSRMSSCCSCSITLEDSRMTPCFHIACLKCLEDIQTKSNKKPGDVLPCPSCGKTFPIPSEGITGLQKDVFLKSPTEIKKSFNEKTVSKTCKAHHKKALDYYCKECDAVVCVSCFVENHKFHDCKDVTTIDKTFRRRLEETTTKLSIQKQGMLSRRLDMERLKTEFLARSLETSKEIKKKSETLKSLIDRHARILLDELSTIEQRHQASMEREIDDIERNTESLDSFVAYCTQMKVKGSASDVCCCACNLIAKAEILSKENEEYLLSPYKLVGTEFIATHLDETVHVGANVIGKLSESSKLFGSKVFVFGIDDGDSLTEDIIKINLNRSEDVYKAQQIPVQMTRGSAAAVHGDSIFVTGIGEKCDEIWRFVATSSKWKKRAFLVQGRQYHSIAFVDHVLYICGGLGLSEDKTLDDVEAYDIYKDQCVAVGKLAFAFYGSGNCVPFKSSLYIFGGYNVDCETVDEAQVYDTKLNTCSLLSTSMPRVQCLLRAVLWENTVILLGYYGCLTYNFETKVCEVRDHFKTDVDHFGLTTCNGLLFVIGGGDNKEDADGNAKWVCRNDVRCIPVVNILKNEPIDWRHHATLPTPSLVYAFGEMDFGLK